MIYPYIQQDKKDNSLSRLIKKIKQRLSYVTPWLEEISSNGTGLYATIDKDHGFSGHNILYELRIVDSNKDLALEKEEGVLSLSDILANWKRYTHSYGPALLTLDNTNSSSSMEGQWAQAQNDWNAEGHTAYLDTTKGGWIISGDMIQSTVDGYPVAGFISNKDSYGNYTLRCKIDTGWDDDNNGIVVGYLKDKDGREHTLTVMRGFGRNDGGNIDTKFWWGLIYDAGNDTQDLLVNLSSTVGTPDWDSGYAGKEDSVNYCYITAARDKQKHSITGKTTRFSKDGNDKTDVDAWTFTYTLPETKPESMSQAEYDNLKSMFTGNNYIGFCVRSS